MTGPFVDGAVAALVTASAGAGPDAVDAAARDARTATGDRGTVPMARPAAVVADTPPGAGVTPGGRAGSHG